MQDQKPPTATPPAGTPPEPTPQPSFLDGLDADLKGYAELKGFKSVGDTLVAYRNLEKFQGVPADKLLKIPDEADQAAVDTMYEKLGRPKTAEEYKFAIPEGQSDEFAKKFAPTLHKAGLNQKQVDILFNDFSAMQQAQIAAEEQKYKETVAAEQAQLKAEWGGKYEANMMLAKKAANVLGVSAEQINALENSTDYKTVMNLFLNIASKMSEDSLRGAGDNGGSFGLTPDAARARLDMLKKDAAWVAKFNAKDVATVEEFNKLSLIASGMKA